MSGSEADDVKRMTLRGIVLGQKNVNGRIYPVEETMAAFERAQNLAVVVDAPDTATIEMSRVCGLVEGFERDGDEIVVRWRLLDTPMSGVIRALMEAKVDLDLMPIGTGMVGEDGTISEYEPTGVYLSPPRASTASA